MRTDFLDHPVGYKGHGRATPYLGGAALIAAFLPPALIFGGGLSDFAAIIGCAVALSVVGTVDDRVGLGPLVRVGFEIAAAVVLWAAGIGWFLFDASLINLLLTVVWVVGVVNAFNLMDNEDGAAAAVGLASSLGVSALALVEGAPLLAAMAVALAGACGAFLRFNLARPSRVFLGDGGSMPLGFLIAAMIAARARHRAARHRGDPGGGCVRRATDPRHDARDLLAAAARRTGLHGRAGPPHAPAAAAASLARRRSR